MSSKILKDISVLPAQHRPLHLASVKFPEYSYLQDIIDIGRGGNEDESGKPDQFWKLCWKMDLEAVRLALKSEHIDHCLIFL